MVDTPETITMTQDGQVNTMPVQLQAPTNDIDATNDYQTLRTNAIDHTRALADPDGPSDTYIVHVTLSSYTGTMHATFTYRNDDHMFDFALFTETAWNTVEFQRRRVVPTGDMHHLGFLTDALSAGGDDVTASVETVTPDELDTAELNDFSTVYYEARNNKVY